MDHDRLGKWIDSMVFLFIETIIKILIIVVGVAVVVAIGEGLILGPWWLRITIAGFFTLLGWAAYKTYQEQGLPFLKSDKLDNDQEHK